MGSPVPLLLIIGLYLHFVTKSGKFFMKNRKPFELNGIMMVYNILQVVMNGALGPFVSIFQQVF